MKTPAQAFAKVSRLNHSPEARVSYGSISAETLVRVGSSAGAIAKRHPYVFFDYTAKGKPSLRLFQLLSAEEPPAFRGSCINTEGELWRKAISRHFNRTGELKQPLVGIDWIDSDPKYGEASQLLWQLVPFRKPMLRQSLSELTTKVERLAANAKHASDLAKVLEPASRMVAIAYPQLGYLGSTSEKERIVRPQVERSVFRGNLELYAGRRNVRKLVSSLCSVATNRKLPQEVRHHARYLLFRTGLTVDEFQRYFSGEGTEASLEDRAFTAAIALVSGIPASAGTATLRALADAKIGNYLSCVFVETSARLQDGVPTQLVNRLLMHKQLPVDADERARLLSLMLRDTRARRSILAAFANGRFGPFHDSEVVLALSSVKRFLRSQRSAGVRGLKSFCRRLALDVGREENDRVLAGIVYLALEEDMTESSNLVETLFSRKTAQEHFISLRLAASGLTEISGFWKIVSSAAASDNVRLRKLSHAAAVAMATDPKAAQIPAHRENAFKVVAKGLQDPNPEVRHRAIGILSLFQVSNIPVPKDFLGRVTRGLRGRKCTAGEVQFAATLAFLMTGGRMPWPPLRDRLPLKPFECEDAWWHRNREAVRLFLLEWLARKVDQTTVPQP